MQSDVAGDALGDGWTLLGHGERATDNGFDDGFWHRGANWGDDASWSHLSMDTDNETAYGGDAKSALWNTLPVSEVLFWCVDSARSGNWAPLAEAYTLPREEPLSRFFASNEQVQSDDGAGNDVVLNHAAARLYKADDVFLGGSSRDIDGMCDHFVFGRGSPERAQSTSLFLSGTSAAILFGDDQDVGIARRSPRELVTHADLFASRFVTTAGGVDVMQAIDALSARVDALQARLELPAASNCGTSPADAAVSCRTILRNCPDAVPAQQRAEDEAAGMAAGVYWILDGETTTSSQQVLCLMQHPSFSDNVDDAGGGGWALVGYNDRLSDGGFGDNYWHYTGDGDHWADKYDTDSMTPMLDTDPGTYPGDVRSPAWAFSPMDEFMVMCAHTFNADTGKVYGARLLGMRTPRAASFSDFWGLEDTQSTVDLVGDVWTTNTGARLNQAANHFIGGAARDIDGECDHFLFTRSSDETKCRVVSTPGNYAWCRPGEHAMAPAGVNVPSSSAPPETWQTTVRSIADADAAGGYARQEGAACAGGSGAGACKWTRVMCCPL